MQTHEMTSEVAQLLAHIEAEYASARQGLTGLAETAKHAFITARMEHIQQLHSQLQQVVGEEAIRLVAERLEAFPG